MIKAEKSGNNIQTEINGKKKSQILSEAVGLLVALKEAGFSLISLCMTAEIVSKKPEKEDK